MNGAASAGSQVWAAQPVSVTANTTYTFTAWVSSLYAMRPSQLEFSINGTSTGTVVAPGSTVGDWQLFTATWFSGTATQAAISLVNLNLAEMGNDFGLDDISFAPNAPLAAAPLLIVEPGSASLLGLGLVGFGLFRRRGD